MVPEFCDQLPYDALEWTDKPLNYRREGTGDAVVWSVPAWKSGYDQTANGGDVDGKEPKDTGFRIHLKEPNGPQK